MGRLNQMAGGGGVEAKRTEGRRVLAQHNYALTRSGGVGVAGGSYFAYVLWLRRRVSHNYAQSQFLNLIKIITVLP